MRPSFSRSAAFLIAIFFAALRLPLAAAPLDDPLLRAMQEELERSKAKLKMDNVAAPYYVEYTAKQEAALAAEGECFSCLRGGFSLRRNQLQSPDSNPLSLHLTFFDVLRPVDARSNRRIPYSFDLMAVQAPV